MPAGCASCCRRKASGSAGTFRFLQQIDADGVGKAEDRASTPTIRTRRSSSHCRADDTVAFFVQFPDPDNPRFKTIQEQGGHIVPVIDRAILRSQVDGQKIYFAQETQVANAKWMKSGRRW